MFSGHRFRSYIEPYATDWKTKPCVQKVSSAPRVSEIQKFLCFGRSRPIVLEAPPNFLYIELSTHLSTPPKDLKIFPEMKNPNKNPNQNPNHQNPYTQLVNQY